jgi:hypothetical protein
LIRFSTAIAGFFWGIHTFTHGYITKSQILALRLSEYEAKVAKREKELAALKGNLDSTG